MNDLEVEDILEHFGVKGMRWGVRNAVSAKVGQAKEKVQNLTPKQKKTIAIGGSAAVTIGAAVVSVILAKKGKTKVYDYGYSYPTVDIGPMGLSKMRFGQPGGL